MSEPRYDESQRPKYPVNIDDLKLEDPLAPSRGCLWGMVLSLGIYALAATVAFVIVMVTR